MKVAILSDIHGNLSALTAVLKKLPLLNVDKVLVLGDMVGYYYYAKEVIELLCTLPEVEFIQGNHERYLIKARHNPSFLKSLKKKYGSSYEKALAEMTEEQLDWIGSLPKNRSLHIASKKVLMCHGSPRDSDEYIYPDASPEKLDACLTDEHDIILMGHTHYPFVNVRRQVILVNPGSVGQPRDNGKLASFVTINFENDALVFHRVPFDPSELIDLSFTIDPNIEYLRKVFNRT